MGKQIREKPSDIPVEKNTTSYPGRVWGILHVMKYHNWRHVKRRLTHRKHSTGRNDAKTDDGAGDNEKMQEHVEPKTNSSNVEEKTVHSSPSGKHSVKSRLKALLTEEISKKMARHKRSSTCPVKSETTKENSFNHLQPSDVNPLNELLLTVESPDANPKTSENQFATALDASQPVLSEEPNIDNNTCGKHQKQPSDVQTHLQPTMSYSSQNVPAQKLIRAKILTTDASPHLFKDFLDALDIINTNQGLLLKVLQDPGYQLHNQPASSGKMRLNKSVSFPVSGSILGSKNSEPGPLINDIAGDRFKGKGQKELHNENQSGNVSRSESSEDLHRPSTSSDSSCKVDKITHMNQELVESSINSLPQGQNQIVIKRFKDLRQKIKHVIEESKEEKQRIAMDAILHKIPRGKNVWMEMTRKVLEQSRDAAASSNVSCLSSYSFNKCQTCPMRTSSLKESVHRYVQLFATTLNKEVKHPKSERLKLKTEEITSSMIKTPKSFQRFLSLPNLKTYFYQSEVPAVVLSPEMPIRKSGEKTLNTCSTDERSFDCNDSKNHVLLPTYADNMIQEIFSEVGKKEFATKSDAGSESYVNKEAIDDFGNLTDSDSAGWSDGDIGHSKAMSTTGETKSVTFSGSSFLDDTIDFEKYFISEDLELKPGLADRVDGSIEDFKELKVLREQLSYEFPHAKVDARNKPEFDYVKEVLELSGFTGNESLGIWHSDDQPIDPLVYEELEGCLLFNPECSRHKGGQCYHLLLFDLINEVLMEIYGRSFSYYPRSLSSLAHIRPMPVGDHVLHEVWTLISWYLSSSSHDYLSLDYFVDKDLAKDDGWMNLQFDSECVGLELDDLIFDDLMEEILCS